MVAVETVAAGEPRNSNLLSNPSRSAFPTAARLPKMAASPGGPLSICPSTAIVTVSRTCLCGGTCPGALAEFQSHELLPSPVPSGL